MSTLNRWRKRFIQFHDLKQAPAIGLLIAPIGDVQGVAILFFWFGVSIGWHK